MLTVKQFTYISLCISVLNQKASGDFTASPMRVIPGQSDKLELKCGPKEGTSDPIIAMMIRKADGVDLKQLTGVEEEEAPPDYGMPGPGEMPGGGMPPINPFQNKYRRKRDADPTGTKFEYASLTGPGVSIVPNNEDKFETEGTLSAPAHFNINIKGPLYEDAGQYVCQITVMRISGQVEVQSQGVVVQTVQVENAEQFGAMRASSAIEQRLVSLESQAKMFVSLGQGLQSSSKIYGEKVKILEEDMAALKRENKDLEDGLEMANAEVKSLNDQVKEMMENQASLLMQADSLMSAHDDIREAHEKAVNVSKAEKEKHAAEEAKEAAALDSPEANNNNNTAAAAPGMNFGNNMEGGGLGGYPGGQFPAFYRGYPANNPYGVRAGGAAGPVDHYNGGGGGRFIGGWHNPAGVGQAAQAGAPPGYNGAPSVEQDLFAVNNRMGALDNTRIQLLETQMQDMQTIALELQGRMNEVAITANYTLPDRIDQLQAVMKRNSSIGVLNRLVHLETQVLPIIMANITQLQIWCRQMNGSSMGPLALGPLALGPVNISALTYETTPGLDFVPTTLPDIPTTLPDVNTTLPYIPTTLPDVPTTLPDIPTTLPYVPTTLPDIPTTLPYVPTTLPDILTTLPVIPTTLPVVPTTLPDVPIEEITEKSTNSEEAPPDPNLRSCYVCGDVATNKGCTRHDQSNTQTCAEPNMECLTDNIQDGFFRKVFRRCGKMQDCVATTATTDKDCYTDPFLTARRMTCHFCCTSNNCNEGIRPATDLYGV